MSTTLTFANHKGGVGKTTSCLNVGQNLARQGHRVLFIDCDPQTNLTMSFDVPDPEGLTLAELLEGNQKASVRNIMQPVGDNQWLVPGSKRLQVIDKLIGGAQGTEFLLRESLEVVAEAFEYVVIDTPPSLGGVTYSALIATDLVFIPVQPEYYGYQGLTELLGACARVRKHANRELRVGGIFFTRYASTYRRALHHQYVDLIRDDVAMAPLVMSVTIRDNVKLGEAQAQHTAIAEYAPDSNGAIDYDSLTEEILKRV
jgi:chromosome partitioning protein